MSSTKNIKIATLRPYSHRVLWKPLKVPEITGTVNNAAGIPAGRHERKIRHGI